MPGRQPFELSVAKPPELGPKKWLTDWVRESGADITIGHDPDEAVKGAHGVVTDIWVSMGDKDGARELLKEVVKEGDTAQQQQAQTMLQALG